LFAHHARGCTIVAAKICSNVVIFQNVTIGSNLRFNKLSNNWENVGNPIIGKNVIIADGAKILGPIVIGADSVVGAGAIVTKNVPANSVAYGVNQFKPKDAKYNLIFNSEMIESKKIIDANKQLIAKFTEQDQ
jgi:serine O-acetyltransferase